MIIGQTHVQLATVDFDLLDAGNVVYHPNYLILCERARNAALSLAGCAFEKLWSIHTALAVLECNAKYFRAIDLNQELAILTQTIESSGSTLRILQWICQKNCIETLRIKPGFNEGLAEPSNNEIFFKCEFLLGFVKLHPIKGARIPGELLSALGIEKRSRVRG